MLVHISPQLHTQQYHDGSLNLDMVEVFIAQKSATTTNQRFSFFFFSELIVKNVLALHSQINIGIAIDLER